jgi:hypothetical protein
MGCGNAKVSQLAALKSRMTLLPARLNDNFVQQDAVGC